MTKNVRHLVRRVTSDAELGLQEVVDALRVGLAARRLHHLADEPAERLRLVPDLRGLVGIGRNDVSRNIALIGIELGRGCRCRWRRGGARAWRRDERDARSVRRRDGWRRRRNSWRDIWGRRRRDFWSRRRIGARTGSVTRQAKREIGLVGNGLTKEKTTRIRTMTRKA